MMQIGTGCLVELCGDRMGSNGRSSSCGDGGPQLRPHTWAPLSVSPHLEPSSSSPSWPQSWGGDAGEPPELRRGEGGHLLCQGVPAWGLWDGQCVLLSSPATSPACLPFITLLSNGNFNARGRKREKKNKIRKARNPPQNPIHATFPLRLRHLIFSFFFFLTRYKSQGNQSYCTRRSRNSATA